MSKAAPPVPVVYLGPTLPAEEAARLLPGCEIRPPLKRGDLYREREAGRSIFLIIDGVFMSQLTAAPREVLDVLGDGALIAGASSMGALRAAECWPAGMRGVGAIHRLYRWGSLGSDDEVAVTFDPASLRPLSVALVNVRWAARRLVRTGALDAASGAAIVRAARDLFYADRTWDVILAAAGLGAERRRWMPLLAAHDLKGDDARRALVWLARAIAKEPVLADRPRLGAAPFASSDRTRERGHDATGGEDAATVRREVVAWLLASGRYARYLPHLAATDPEIAERLRRKHVAAGLLLAARQAPDALATGGLPSPREGRTATRQALSPAALRLVWHDLWTEALASEQAFAERLWPELILSGELDAELFRLRAIRGWAARARAASVAPDRRALLEARARVAHAHGFDSWAELAGTCRDVPGAWPRVAAYSEELARALMMRQRTSPGST